MSLSLKEGAFDPVALPRSFQYPPEGELKDLLLKRVQIVDEYHTFSCRKRNGQEEEAFWNESDKSVVL